MAFTLSRETTHVGENSIDSGQSQITSDTIHSRSDWISPANTGRSLNVVSIPGHHIRRWHNIKTELAQFFLPLDKHVDQDYSQKMLSW